MGSAVGTSPGRLVETDSDFNIIAEHPKDVTGLTNILGEQFSPHGLSVDWEKNILYYSIERLDGFICNITNYL